MGDPGRHPARRRDTDRAAIAAAAWAALLYASIPFVRPIQRTLAGRTGSGWITVVVLIAVAAALVGAFILVRRSPRPTTLFDLAWLVAIAACAAAAAWHLRRQPEEAVHLLQFGVLAVLIYRALRAPEPDVAILAAVAVLGALVGTVDEIIQWIVPERFWDLRDVAVNAGACALAAAAQWRLDPGPWRRPRASSVSLALRLGAAQILLLTLCLANTPQRVAWYAVRVPGLELLAHADNAMAEYGFRHHLPGIGDMKSRLTLGELEEQDRARAGEVAELLDRYPEGRYARFLEDHSEVADPFLYEARVHLSSRDVHLRQLRDAVPGSAAAREAATIALREQQLLERVFGGTLARSSFDLKPQRRRQLEQACDPERPFASSSAAHLITGVSQRGLRIVLLAAAAILLAVDAAIRRRIRLEVTA